MCSLLSLNIYNIKNILKIIWFILIEFSEQLFETVVTTGNFLSMKGEFLLYKIY